jgi:zinc transporter ZupT
MHGFFEGIALGIQEQTNGTLFLAFAILAHKWAEAFTLVNLLYKLREFPFLKPILKEKHLLI